jgi:hypothetical protein
MKETKVAKPVQDVESMSEYQNTYKGKRNNTALNTQHLVTLTVA